MINWKVDYKWKSGNTLEWMYAFLVLPPFQLVNSGDKDYSRLNKIAYQIQTTTYWNNIHYTGATSTSAVILPKLIVGSISYIFKSIL